jgi:hypothetical protein
MGLWNKLFITTLILSPLKPARRFSASETIARVLKARKHFSVHRGIGGAAHWGEIEGSNHIKTK